MHLWNDYEGKTIAEAYPLEKLLFPEGRSAFFTTRNGTGKPSVIRLTESLNDEHEILERWRQVSEVHQENLVEIRKYGQTIFDGVPLTYALMEATDSSLAEILAERPLTPGETVEVASSLVAALKALHEKSLIHERVEPANVLASGDLIKLRSDCVRECIVDGEFTTAAMCDELRRKDVQDLATVLLRCLTLERTLKPGVRLPAPFDAIVPRGLDGSWGLKEMDAVLHPPQPQPLAAPAVVVAAAAGTGPVAGVVGRAAQPSAARAPLVPPVANPPVQAALPFASDANAGPTLTTRRFEESAETPGLPVPKSWLVGGGVVATVLLLLWFLIPSKSSGPAAPPAKTEKIATIDDAPDGRGTPAAVVTSSAPVVLGKRAEGSAASAKSKELDRGRPERAATAAGTISTQPGWRVVCYTFTRQEDAWTRAGAIHRAHPGLSPQVFKPSPRGPYLLTLGGAMTRPEAEAMLRNARRDGMPRDTFIRPYGVR